MQGCRSVLWTGFVKAEGIWEESRGDLRREAGQGMSVGALLIHADCCRCLYHKTKTAERLTQRSRLGPKKTIQGTEWEAAYELANIRYYSSNTIVLQCNGTGCTGLGNGQCAPRHMLIDYCDVVSPCSALLGRLSSLRLKWKDETHIRESAWCCIDWHFVTTAFGLDFGCVMWFLHDHKLLLWSNFPSKAT